MQRRRTASSDSLGQRGPITEEQRASIVAEKKALRLELKAKLRALAPLSSIEAIALQENLLASKILDPFHCVALYLALPSEPPTELLLQTLLSRGIRIALPRLGDRIEALSPLEFREAGGELKKSALGFLEPSSDREAIPIDQIEAFVIPALAIDRQGNRLGRGRGHYDVTLAANPDALRIGLVREAALLDKIPAADHDEPLDAIATERSFILPRS